MQDRILHYVSIMDRAGEETFIMNVFRTIDRSQLMFDFLVTQNREGDYDQEIRSLGGIVRHLRLGTTGGPTKRLKNYLMLKEYLKPLHEQYTTFHIHTQHAMDAMLDAMAAKFAGFRTVVVHSHSTSTLHHVWAHYICRPILNLLPIVRLACSKNAGIWLFGKHGAFEMIRNGIITSDYLFRDEIRRQLRRGEGWENRIVIGHVGSFTYPKNHAFLLDIFQSFLQLHPEALLVMAGKGDLMEEIGEKARELGIDKNVRFLGSRGDVNRLYSAFDSLVFPSHYEGLPVTLVEAQAADLPCLISDTISVETDINPNLVRMSLQESPAAWAEKLDTLIADHKRVDRSREISESGYDIHTAAKRLEEIYRRDE